MNLTYVFISVMLYFIALAFCNDYGCIIIIRLWGDMILLIVKKSRPIDTGRRTKEGSNIVSPPFA